MAKVDPEQERQRLTQFYSQQLDGELEKLARQGYELTDAARSALKAELANRGLTIQIVESSPVVAEPASPSSVRDLPEELPSGPSPEPEASGELEYRRLVTVKKFRDLPEALLAKGSLDSAGIDNVLLNGNLVRLDWFWSNMAGGIVLQVEPEDLEVAREILEQPIPASLDVPGAGEYTQPHCPKCGSLDVTFQELDKPISYATAFFHVPVPWHRRAWRCHACDVEWEDDAKTQESMP